VNKILFLGDLNSYARSSQRYNTLIDLGCKVDGLSFVEPETTSRITPPLRLWSRIRNRLGYPVDETNINERILDYIDHETPDLIWNEKGLMIKPSTLKTIKESYPKVKLVFYSEDDMFAKHNQSKYFRDGLLLHDIVFSTKSYNCNPDELPSLGAKKVLFVAQAFDRNTHRPIPVNDKDRLKFGSDVGFIGTYEKDRAEKILFLAESKVKVRVWGNGWKNWVGKHPNFQIENKPIYNEDYIKAICATKINLGFLRKINRDLHTSRTIEIPACEGFLLAERTNEHQRLFEKNKEAVYFDIENPGELLEKIRYYLEHDEEREAIAKAARERCLKSGYSHHDRLSWMLKQILS
jgi:spore maturation protein CgeB